MLLVIGLVGLIAFWTYIGKEVVDACADVIKDS